MKIVLAISLLVVVVSAGPTTKAAVGARVDVDPTKPDVKELIQFAYTRIHDSINSAHALLMGKVLKAQSQVVSGVKYYFTLEVNETDCARNVDDVSKCKVIKTQVCEAVILSRPWDKVNPRAILSYNCKNN